MDYCSWHNVMQEGYLVSDFFLLLWGFPHFHKLFCLLVLFFFISICFCCWNLRVCEYEMCAIIYHFSIFFASCNLVSGSTPDGYIEESIFCSFFSSLLFLWLFMANLIYRFSMFVCYICKYSLYAIWCSLRCVCERAHIYKFYGYFFAHVLTINIPHKRLALTITRVVNNTNTNNMVWYVRVCIHTYIEMDR